MQVMLACGKYNLVHEFFKKIHKSANALTYKGNLMNLLSSDILLHKFLMDNIYDYYLFSYVVLVNTHWKEGNIDLAVRVVKEMEGRGIIGTSGLYYDLARGLCSAGRCQEALMQVGPFKIEACMHIFCIRVPLVAFLSIRMYCILVVVMLLVC